MRRRCSYIFAGPRGTSVAYGWAVDSRGEVRGVHGPTEYLIRPEGGDTPQWTRASAIDFRPIRREPVTR